MKRILCDHCGKELTEEPDYVDYDIVLEEVEYSCDLCAECLDEILDYLDSHIKDFIGCTAKKEVNDG